MECSKAKYLEAYNYPIECSKAKYLETYNYPIKCSKAKYLETYNYPIECSKAGDDHTILNSLRHFPHFSTELMKKPCSS